MHGGISGELCVASVIGRARTAEGSVSSRADERCAGATHRSEGRIALSLSHRTGTGLIARGDGSERGMGVPRHFRRTQPSRERVQPVPIGSRGPGPLSFVMIAQMLPGRQLPEAHWMAPRPRSQSARASRYDESSRDTIKHTESRISTRCRRASPCTGARDYVCCKRRSSPWLRRHQTEIHTFTSTSSRSSFGGRTGLVRARPSTRRLSR